MVDAFLEGECYTRRSITDVLGSGMQDVLPHKGGISFAAASLQR